MQEMWCKHQDKLLGQGCPNVIPEGRFQAQFAQTHQVNLLIVIAMHSECVWGVELVKGLNTGPQGQIWPIYEAHTSQKLVNVLKEAVATTNPRNIVNAVHMDCMDFCIL